MSARTGTAPSWGAVRARRPGGRGGGDRWGPSEIARRTGGHDDGGPAATGYGRRPAGAGSGGDAASALMARLRAALRAAVRSARLPSQLISGDEAIARITRTISTALMGRVKNWARSQLVLITDCMKLRSTIGPSTIPSTTGASGIR